MFWRWMLANHFHLKKRGHSRVCFVANSLSLHPSQVFSEYMFLKSFFFMFKFILVRNWNICFLPSLLIWMFLILDNTVFLSSFICVLTNCSIREIFCFIIWWKYISLLLILINLKCSSQSFKPNGSSLFHQARPICCTYLPWWTKPPTNQTNWMIVLCIVQSTGKISICLTMSNMESYFWTYQN